MTRTMISDDRSKLAAELLGYTGFRGPFSLAPLSGGKNNQVFRVDLADRTLVLKCYFQHPGDLRDRLGAEYAFSAFAWNAGVRSLPEPIGCDAAAGMAIYSYIPGRKLQPEEATAERVAEAGEFFRQLNVLRNRPEATRLPAGSEACFRLMDHLHCLSRRIDRLGRAVPATEIDREAARFIGSELTPLCNTALQKTEDEATRLGISLQAELSMSDRCVSPSDFGFHNALLTPQGRLTFLDFEYAGWDDPAKTACDFFCQPELPAPLASFPEFCRTVTAGLSDPQLHIQRCELLLPIYRLKWCCIMLNDFLPAGNQRRQFAGGADERDRKSRQLEKARRAAAVAAAGINNRAAA